jgi:hypothetical protein
MSMSGGKTMTDWIDKWLSPPRFAPYLTAAEGDRDLGLALYERNSALGSALMHDIGHFEVAVRNAYDAAFAAHWDRDDHWLLSPESPVVTPIWRVREVDRKTRLKRGIDVNERNRRSVDQAIQRSGRGAAAPVRCWPN